MQTHHWLRVIKEKTSIKIFAFFILCFAPGMEVFAARQSSISAGDIAGNIFGVGMDVRAIVRFVSIVAGVSMILGSLLQYKKYRQNPVETTLGTVIFTFVIGVGLILLSFIPVQID